MSERADLQIPAFEGVMEVAYTHENRQTGELKGHILQTRDLKIPLDMAMDVQAFYMLMGQKLEPEEMNSVTFFAQNATEEEQKNFPVLYAGKITGKDADGTVHFLSRMGNIKGALRAQDILLDEKTGKLIDGATGEFDTSRKCLERLFDFPTYAAPDNPPKKTILRSEISVRTSQDETHLPTHADVNAANLKVAQNWNYNGR